MSSTPFVNAQGDYVVTVTVDLTVERSSAGYEVTVYDLVDVLTAQMTRLDGVKRVVLNDYGV